MDIELSILLRGLSIYFCMYFACKNISVACNIYFYNLMRMNSYNIQMINHSDSKIEYKINQFVISVEKTIAKMKIVLLKLLCDL